MQKKEPKGYRLWQISDFAFNASDSEIFNDPRVNRWEYSWEYTTGKNEVKEEHIDAGRIHKQGEIEFFNPVPRSVIWKLFKWEVHCEPVRYQKAHKGYINNPEKEGWIEHKCFGPKFKPGQGSRTDIHAAMEDIKQGAKMKDILFNHPSVFFKYPKGVAVAMETVDDEPEVCIGRKQAIVYWGNSGTAKSHQAECKEGKGNVYRVSKEMYLSKFWLKYQGQKVLLLDDFNGSWMTFESFKGLLDLKPSVLNVKGTDKWCRWEKVYITSNEHPQNWWKNKMGDPLALAALKERCKGGVHHITEKIVCGCFQHKGRSRKLISNTKGFYQLFLDDVPGGPEGWDDGLWKNQA